MTLKFFKSVKSAVVLAGIAGVLFFTVGAWAKGASITVTEATTDTLAKIPRGVPFSGDLTFAITNCTGNSGCDKFAEAGNVTSETDMAYFLPSNLGDGLSVSKVTVDQDRERATVTI